MKRIPSGLEHTEAPVSLSRRTAILLAACLLAAGATASTWLQVWMLR